MQETSDSLWLVYNIPPKWQGELTVGDTINVRDSGVCIVRWIDTFNNQFGAVQLISGGIEDAG